MIYFTSDTHFGQERTLVLSKRPFTCVEEMDRIMIANWNSIVKHDDIVFHLGDFGNYDVAKQLNGSIYLIRGNYERKDIEEGKITLDYLEHIGIQVISDNEQITHYIPETEEKICMQLQHEPSKCDKNIFNLFGHIHGRQMRTPRHGCSHLFYKKMRNQKISLAFCLITLHFFYVYIL